MSTNVVRPSTLATGEIRWRFGFRTPQKPDILIIARMNDEDTVRDYFLLPFVLSARNWIIFGGNNNEHIGAFRTTSLDLLVDLCARVPVRLPTDPMNPVVSPFQGSRDQECDKKNDDLAVLIGELRKVIGDSYVSDLLAYEGFRTVPKFLKTATPELKAPTNHFEAGKLWPSQRVLEFVVAWFFVLQLAARPRIATEISRRSPDFFSKFADIFLSTSIADACDCRSLTTDTRPRFLTPPGC